MRLLLAEDEKSLARAIGTILEKNHYSIDLVYNGRDALDYLMSDTYDGAILDIMMPEMDGITVLKKLRNLGISTPVLLLTAKSEVEDKVNGLDSGANDYLTKPFATQELLARIRAMTRTNTAQSSSRMHMGNITLDRATFEMSTPFGSFRLANREFQMMETLISNPGHVIPSERFPETPYSTRYFSVRLNTEDGTVLSVDTGKIAAIDADAAEAYAAQVWQTRRLRGFSDTYRYGVLENDRETLMVFLDCRQNISTFQSFW